MPLFLMQPTTENHKIKIWAHEISTRKKSWIDELTTRKISYPRNTLEKKYWIHKIPTKARWHDDTRLARPTMSRDPRKLAFE